MKPAQFLRFRDRSQILLREKPLPDEIFCGVPVFLIQLIFEKHAGIPPFQVLVMSLLDPLKLRQQFLHDRLRDGDRARFLSLSVYDGQHSFVEIEVLHAQLQAFEQTKSTAVQKFHSECHPE